MMGVVPINPEHSGLSWAAVATEMWGNDRKRREWLNNYSDWGAWFKTPELKLIYYKFELPDGSAIIACEHDSAVTGRRAAFYLMENGGVFAPEFQSGPTAVCERLKSEKRAAVRRLFPGDRKSSDSTEKITT
jgi:hypothetical protein